MLGNHLLTPEEQTQAGSTTAARPCQQLTAEEAHGKATTAKSSD